MVNVRLIHPVLDDVEPKDDPLSPAEVEFIHLQRNPRAWRQWCAEVRAGWSRSPGGLLAARRRKETHG